jgi:hypothetical protein
MTHWAARLLCVLPPLFGCTLFGSAHTLHPCAPCALQVAAAPGFESWQLYLVDWGYNTAAERERAGDSSRITVIDVQQFADLMRGKLA